MRQKKRCRFEGAIGVGGARRDGESSSASRSPRVPPPPPPSTAAGGGGGGVVGGVGAVANGGLPLPFPPAARGQPTDREGRPHWRGPCPHDSAQAGAAWRRRRRGGAVVPVLGLPQELRLARGWRHRRRGGGGGDLPSGGRAGFVVAGIGAASIGRRESSVGGQELP